MTKRNELESDEMNKQNFRQIDVLIILPKFPKMSWISLGEDYSDLE